MGKKLFTLEEAREMKVEELKIFDKLRSGKVGDWVTVDEMDVETSRVFNKYVDSIKLEFHGCIMNRSGYKITEETDTSLIPDVSDIIVDKEKLLYNNECINS